MPAAVDTLVAISRQGELRWSRTDAGDMLDFKLRMEEFSRAMVGAVASSVGVCWGRPPGPDVDGIDTSFWLKAKGAPRLEAQLKSTYRELLMEDGLHYPLKLGNYDELRITDCDVPRILIVVVMPQDPAKWLITNPDSMVLRHAIWWKSLRGMAATANGTEITLTLTDVFDGAALLNLMERP